MVNLFGSLRFKPHIGRDAAALALDLTTEAITLHERTPQGLWKKFASVRLDDPEFPIVIGLLRDEAEAHAGKLQPVLLWLPGEQVLKLRVRIKGSSPAARLRAGFDYIDKETAYRPGDVVIAVAPTDRGGEATLLITFAETWRDAMECATRWGFIPGALSTRHHAVDFGADGPVFRLKALPADPGVPKKQHRLAVAVLALLVVAGGAAVWSLGPWADKSGAPGSLPGTEAIELADAPALTPSPEPNFAPLPAPGPAMPVPDLPPRHFPNSPAPDIPSDTDQPPNIGTAQKAPNFSAPVYSIAAPAVIAAAPSPPPAPEPEPPRPDPVVRWVGPLAALKPSGISTLPVLQANFMALMPRPTWRGKVSLIANNISSSETPEPAPMVQQPPAEPVETAIEAIKPIAPEPIAPVIVLATSDVVEWTEQSKVAASAEPATPLILSELIWAISTPFPAPIPLPRPRHTDPVGDRADIVEKQPVATETQSIARAMPVPRPSKARASEIQPNATMAATPPGSGSETQIKTNQEYSDEPTKYASATSPVPTSRPAFFTRARGFPSPVILPALSDEETNLIGSTATEPGMPLGITMLVGILSFETGRRALLRLPDGSYHYVIVGDVLDGWRVSMIGVDAMRITRSGEDRTLLMINR